ncbi:MAG: efflux RND transporter periplasmic adaptor subunit, partial [Gammaproteobacteria bacterium]|nr:efflux RND transporter periplasmic adaptor subunit [Gammaproteobacteria bacterium]
MASGDFTPPPATIAAGTAAKKAWRQTIDSVGTVRAARGILLSAQISGDVTAILAESGALVEAGQPLIAIDEELELATRERLQARLALAEQLYDRDARLIKENSISQTQLDQSSADLRSARAELAELDAILAKKRIAAPFSGKLGIFKVRIGDYVEAASALVTLQDVSNLELDFSVPDRYAPLMRPGLAIALRTA